MAYTLDTTGNSPEVNFPSFGKTMVHPASWSISSILDNANQLDLFSYPDIQNAIDSGDIIISNGTDEIKYVSLLKQTLKMNEEAVFSKFIVSLTAPGLLTTLGYNFQIDGLSLSSNMGICYDVPWQILSANFLIGTAPVGTSLIFQTKKDGSAAGNITIPAGQNKFSYVPPINYIINADQVFNLQTNQASSAQNVIVNLKIKLLEEI